MNCLKIICVSLLKIYTKYRVESGYVQDIRACSLRSLNLRDVYMHKFLNVIFTHHTHTKNAFASYNVV